MQPELDLRLVRSFVAVAEELHFTRAAQRLHVAQQALSRDVRRLEAQLGARLLVRSTRRVTLTADGERLLSYACSLLALNDAALRELRGVGGSLLVDVIREGVTAARIVDVARSAAPGFECTVRYGGGLGAALPQLLSGRLDVAFGRPDGLGRPFPAELTRRLVRYEPLALLIPSGHPLSTLGQVPLQQLRGVEIDASCGNDDAPEWVNLGVSLIEAFGARPSAPHIHVVGTSETARHLEAQGLPILTMSECPAVAGGVIRPLVEPIPLYPWAMVHRRGDQNPKLARLASVVADLADKEGWHTVPDGAWLPYCDPGWRRSSQP